VCRMNLPHLVSPACYDRSGRRVGYCWTSRMDTEWFVRECQLATPKDSSAQNHHKDDEGQILCEID